MSWSGYIALGNTIDGHFVETSATGYARQKFEFTDPQPHNVVVGRNAPFQFTCTDLPPVTSFDDDGNPVYFGTAITCNTFAFNTLETAGTIVYLYPNPLGDQVFNIDAPVDVIPSQFKINVPTPHDWGAQVLAGETSYFMEGLAPSGGWNNYTGDMEAGYYGVQTGQLYRKGPSVCVRSSNDGPDAGAMWPMWVNVGKPTTGQVFNVKSPVSYSLSTKLKESSVVYTTAPAAPATFTLNSVDAIGGVTPISTFAVSGAGVARTPLYTFRGGTMTEPFTWGVMETLPDSPRGMLSFWINVPTTTVATDVVSNFLKVDGLSDSNTKISFYLKLDPNGDWVNFTGVGDCDVWQHVFVAWDTTIQAWPNGVQVQFLCHGGSNLPDFGVWPAYPYNLPIPFNREISFGGAGYSIAEFQLYIGTTLVSADYGFNRTAFEDFLRDGMAFPMAITTQKYPGNVMAYMADSMLANAGYPSSFSLNMAAEPPTGLTDVPPPPCTGPLASDVLMVSASVEDETLPQTLQIVAPDPADANLDGLMLCLVGRQAF